MIMSTQVWLVLLIIKIMDPILTLGLFAFLCGILFLFSVGFIFHCMVATLECMDKTVSVFSPPYRTSIKDMQAILPQWQHGLYPIYRCLCFLCIVFTFLYFGCYKSLDYKLLKMYKIPSNSSKFTQNNTTKWIILFPWYISWWISFIEFTWVNS